MPRKKKKIRNALITDRDFDLLKFLWKFKVGTTAALAQKFYPEKSLRRAYDRLHTLEKAEYLKAEKDLRWKKHLWTLDKKGFLTIQNDLPPLAKKFINSPSPGHDLLCSATLLGDLLLNPSDEVRIITDQQLLSYDNHMVDLRLKNEVCAAIKEHRTDGYWFFPQTNTLIALEVQLSSQRKEAYERAIIFYGEDPIKYCIWVCASAQLIYSIFATSQLDSKNTKHQFVIFDDLLNYGWGAHIHFGSQKPLTIRDLLFEGWPQEKIPKENNDIFKLLLDVRKSPHMAVNELYYDPKDSWAKGKP
jgi:hypothetical protein